MSTVAPQPQPVITRAPRNVTLVAGARAQFVCEVTAGMHSQLNWYWSPPSAAARDANGTDMIKLKVAGLIACSARLHAARCTGCRQTHLVYIHDETHVSPATCMCRLYGVVDRSCRRREEYRLLQRRSSDVCCCCCCCLFIFAVPTGLEDC